MGLAGVCALWWAYFDRLQEVMESALRLADAHQTGLIARDVYSLLHYPMIVGIVFYAVALKEAFLHPDDPMEGVVAVLFVVALGLYLLAQAAAVWRCWRTYLYERVIGVAVIAVLLAARDGAAKDVVFVSTIVLIATMNTWYRSDHCCRPTRRTPENCVHPLGPIDSWRVMAPLWRAWPRRRWRC